MTCTCRARLLDAARDLLLTADKAERSTRTRKNAPWVRRRAQAYAAAAGYLAQPRHDPEGTP